MAPISAVTRLAPTPPAVPRLATRSVPVAEVQPAPVAAGPTWRDRSDAPAAPRYGVAAYLAAGGLVADRARGEALLELSTRVLADGGRVSVARRFDGGRTVGIEAVVG